MKEGLFIYKKLISEIGLKKNIFYIFPILIFIASIFEILSLGILYPVSQFLIDNNVTEKYSFLPKNLNYNIFIPLTMILVFGLKFVYLSILSYKKNSFVSNVNMEFSELMAKRIEQFDFLDYNKINDSEKIRLIHRESMYLGDYTLTLINLISEVLITLMITLLLIFNNVYIAGLLMLVGIISMLFYKLIINRTSLLSKGRVEQDYYINNSLYKLVKSYKSIIVFDKLKYYLKDFKLANNLKAKLIANLQTIQSIQSYFLETIFIVIISLILLSGTYLKLDFINMVPMLVLFFAGLIKIMPSINKISYLSSTRIVLDEHLKILFDYCFNYKLKEKKNGGIEDVFKDSIRFSNLSFSYGKKKILNNLNFEIKKGDVFGITGLSGSGKTTILNLLLGLIKPDSGEILIDGSNKSKTGNFQKKIGLCDQTIFLTNDSIETNITMGDKDFSTNFYNSIIEKTQLKNFISNIDNDFIIDEATNNISGGQLQRIGIARALFSNREILILDEFTSAIDPKTKITILNNLFKKRDNKTFIIVSHDSEVIKYCNKVIDLNDIDEKK
tara:strand:+ start:3707 stop:5377 length:1671 start_codon:yes stop_codon:yes gene_type:complete